MSFLKIFDGSNDDPWKTDKDRTGDVQRQWSAWALYQHQLLGGKTGGGESPWAVALDSKGRASELHLLKFGIDGKHWIAMIGDRYNIYIYIILLICIYCFTSKNPPEKVAWFLTRTRSDLWPKSESCATFCHSGRFSNTSPHVFATAPRFQGRLIPSYQVIVIYRWYLYIYSIT